MRVPISHTCSGLNDNMNLMCFPVILLCVCVYWLQITDMYIYSTAKKKKTKQRNQKNPPTEQHTSLRRERARCFALLCFGPASLLCVRVPDSKSVRRVRVCVRACIRAPSKAQKKKKPVSRTPFKYGGGGAGRRFAHLQAFRGWVFFSYIYILILSRLFWAVFEDVYEWSRYLSGVLWMFLFPLWEASFCAANMSGTPFSSDSSGFTAALTQLQH